MIDRKKLVAKHNPVLADILTSSPLTVGNGNFAYTCDITGMQSLYAHYESVFPLCTMSSWGWHSTPAQGLRGYTINDLVPTEYDYNGRTVTYPVKRKAGNEHVYDWLRHNPHKFNLARIGLTFNGRQIEPNELSNIHQELHLLEGRIESRFELAGQKVLVHTSCHHENDMLAFEIHSEFEGLGIEISFPYGHHGISGSDWLNGEAHTTTIKADSDNVVLRRRMDDVTYDVSININSEHEIRPLGAHHFTMDKGIEPIRLCVSFDNHLSKVVLPECSVVFEQTKNAWNDFWQTCGIADFTGTTDSRALELERRIILSLYLSKIQSGGLPPAETGLTCNSWYGKFHLEMHLWHMAYLPLWNLDDTLKESLAWYKEIMPEAALNAARNKYKGVRWPKMVAYDGLDCPSPIAPLLVWQQPHVMYMLELLYIRIGDADEAAEFLEEHWDIISASADFIADFFVLNADRDTYDLVAPLIPAQEVFDATAVLNPTFELEYLRFGLGIAISWARRLDVPSSSWRQVHNKIADLPEADGLYLSHENCYDTFTAFNQDHPSMLGAFGLINSDRANADKMLATINRVLECWEMQTMWGWDFAMMAMTATRCSRPDLAMDLLMMDTAKNTYVTSGNNFQQGRSDLPLYLPGNGSLLLAAGLMLAGWQGSGDKPGIPTGWQVKYENIHKFPK